MVQGKYLSVILCLGLGVFSLTSCGKKKVSEVSAPPTIEETSDSDLSVTEDSMSDASEQGILNNMPVIYFELDQSTLSAESRTLLQEIATALNEQSNVSITIEGHCDERGSNEYNLALGERRARSVQEYIQRLGVAAGRLNPVSYGEERPADPGTGEASWSKNRRVEFSISR